MQESLFYPLWASSVYVSHASHCASISKRLWYGSRNVSGGAHCTFKDKCRLISRKSEKNRKETPWCTIIQVFWLVLIFSTFTNILTQRCYCSQVGLYDMNWFLRWCLSSLVTIPTLELFFIMLGMDRYVSRSGTNNYECIDDLTQFVFWTYSHQTLFQYSRRGESTFAGALSGHFQVCL